MRQRVLEAIRVTGYRVNVTARVLKSGRTGVIGLAVPDIGHAYFGHLATLVIAEAQRHGLHVALEQTGAVEAGSWTRSPSPTGSSSTASSSAPSAPTPALSGSRRATSRWSCWENRDSAAASTTS
ncbi:hypothetical protein GCM10029992_33640 [Glycomyces albus]